MVRQALLPITLVVLSLAACATPRDRVASALIDAGVPETPANCFSADVTSQLSISELRAIAASVDEAREQGRSLTLGDALRLAREAGDARTAGIIVAAAARCA
jgi:hypothetical protein